MKRALRIYGWAWVCLLTATAITALVMAIFPSHHKLAKNPAKVDKVVGVDLPELTNIQSTNNLDRTASRWDWYSHSAEFTEPLSAKTIAKLDELCETDSCHWYKYNTVDCYMYHDTGGIDELYGVECAMYKDHVNISYSVDECEGIIVWALVSLHYTLFFIWGVVLCIIALVRWMVRATSSR